MTLIKKRKAINHSSKNRELRRSGVFQKFGLFIAISQLPMYYFLFVSLQSLAPLDVKVDHQSLVPTDDIIDDDVHAMALIMKDVDVAPSKIVVLGDYSSGLTHINDVLKDAFGEKVVMMHGTPYRSGVLQQTELDRIQEKNDILWIMAVRSPCDWSNELINVQKSHCAEAESTSKQCNVKSMKEYYSMEWLEEVQDDYDEWIIPSSNEDSITYTELFSMRFKKLSIMKQIMEANPRHAKIVQIDQFELDPTALVNDLHKEYLFQQIDSSSAYPPNSNPRQFTCLGSEEWKIAQERIDWMIEGYFGYNKLDCHLCRNQASTQSKIYLLGERNSGTTFVSDTLAVAFDPPSNLGSKFERFSVDIPVLLHKHMFRHDLLNATEVAEIKRRDDIFWIMVVRSPCDWAEAMMRKPYHLCSAKHPERCGPGTDTLWMNHNNIMGTQLVDFFTSVKWIDWAESTYFMRTDALKNGQATTVDPYSISKPGTNYTYPNVFALRKHKLRLMKQIIDIAPHNVKFARLNEFERGPGLFIESLVKEFDIKVKAEYQTPNSSSYSHTTTCLTPEEWTAAQSEIDWRLEAYFGFSPHDCRMCYGYNKSERLYTRVMKQKKRGENLQPGRFGGGRRNKAGKV